METEIDFDPCSSDFPIQTDDAGRTAPTQIMYMEENHNREVPIHFIIFNKTENQPEAANMWNYMCAMKWGLDLLTNLDISHAWATAYTEPVGAAHWAAKHESALKRESHELHEQLFPGDHDDHRTPIELPVVPAKK